MINLFSEKCPTVNVLPIQHWNSQMYFYFNEEEFSKMVGFSNWNGKMFDVVQKGSRFWTGRIMVWKGQFWNSASYGRRVYWPMPGQFAPGDTITLKSCKENGNF